MPIPDRVRASLQLIHYYAEQSPSVVRCIQRALKHYGRVLQCHVMTVWPVPTAATLWLGRVWAFCWFDSQNSGGVDVLA